jgi:hypothetical protein
MSFDGKILAEGQVAASKTTVYTVPANTVVYISQILFFNTAATTETVTLYLNLSGTSRQVKRFVLDQNESAEVMDSGQRLILEAADLIEASSTNATSVDLVITGVEET